MSPFLDGSLGQQEKLLAAHFQFVPQKSRLVANLRLALKLTRAPKLACYHALSLFLCNLFSSREAKKKKTPDLRLLQDVLSNPLKKESLIVHLRALVNFNASLRFATIRLT